jgi:hypothetical protein
MQIFGQVWLWSLGSFLLGVLFTWLLLVKPARKRIGELEDAALSSPRPTRVASPVAEPSDQPGPNKTDRFLDDLFESQRQPQMPSHLQPVMPPPVAPPPVMPPPPPAPLMALPEPTAPPEPPIPDESDTELSDAPFRQFTQSTTVFVPPANLPQPPDVAGGGEDWFSKEDEADPHAITDVEDDEQVDDRGMIFTQHTTPIPADMIRSLDDSQPAQARHEHLEQDEEIEQIPQAAQFDQAGQPSQFDEAAHFAQSEQSSRFAEAPQSSAEFGQTPQASRFAEAPRSSQFDEAAESGQPSQFAEAPRPSAHYDQSPESSQFADGSQSSAQFDQAAQFDQPQDSSHFAGASQFEQAPQSSQGSQSSQFDHPAQFAAASPEASAEITQHFEPAQVEHFEPPHQPDPQDYESARQYQHQPVHVGGHQAEQFEAPAESGRSLFEPVVPVGELEEAAADDFVPPGPFGPGSAMPLPGGGAPAPEFNVKASVTALRYCTQDNPQFDRIVAEVWFRTPSDAERVGFRVLS